MPRYSTRTKSAWDGDEIEFEPTEPLVPNLQVDHCASTDTGLVDASGRSIVRLANPMGFQAEIE